MTSVLDTSTLGMQLNHSSKTFDALLQIVAPGTAQTTATASAVLEIGRGLVDADLVLDVDASTGVNSVAIQFSTDAAFTTPVNGPSIAIPASMVGKVILPFRNSKANEAPYPYMRILPTVGTTLTIGAFVAKK